MACLFCAYDLSPTLWEPLIAGKGLMSHRSRHSSVSAAAKLYACHVNVQVMYDYNARSFIAPNCSHYDLLVTYRQISWEDVDVTHILAYPLGL